MKKLRLLACMLCLALLLTATLAEEGFTNYTLGSTNFSVPSDWLVKYSDDGKSVWFYAEEMGSINGGYLYVLLSDINAWLITDANASSTYQAIIDAAYSDDPTVEIECQSNHHIGRAQGHMESLDPNLTVSTAIYQNGADLLTFSYVNPDQMLEELQNTLDEFVMRIGSNDSEENAELRASESDADFDIDNLSYDELLALRAEIDAKLWASEEWEEVTVPAGVYLVGKDIPAGRWVITAESNCILGLYREMDESGEPKDDIEWTGAMTPDESVVWELHDGVYFRASMGSVVFHHSTGAELGFK